MKNYGILLCIALLACFTCTAASADDKAIVRGTKLEAEAIVKKAISEIKTAGPDKALAEFSDPKGGFIDRDLFIVAYDTDGICLAHGLIKQIVGKNRLDEQDADGKFHVKERLEMMKRQPSSWTRIKFPDPLTHKLAYKDVYCETAHYPAKKDMLICSGAYDPLTAPTPVPAAKLLPKQ